MTPEQIHEAVNAITRGAVPDYQIAAWLMAIFFKGLTLKEKVELTLAMRDSGEKLQFAMDSSRPIVESTPPEGSATRCPCPLPLCWLLWVSGCP